MRIPTVMIGTGRIGWSLETDPLRYHPCSHAGTVRKLSRPTNARQEYFDLIGASDQNGENLNRFYKWWNQKSITVSSDWKSLLAELSPEFVIVATPPESHFAIAREALLGGARQVLIEKPVSFDLRDAKSLLKLARRKKSSVYINFERRFHPGYLLLHEYIKKDLYGPLRSFRSRVLTGSGFDPANGSGPLIHDAVHLIDLMVHWFGAPQKIQSIVSRKGGERPTESVHAMLEYPEFVGTIESAGNRKYFEFEMELDFESGRILAGNHGFTFYTSNRSVRYSGFRELELTRPFRRLHWKNPWVLMYEKILLDRKNSSSPDTSMLRDAITGLDIIDGIYKSI